MNQYKFLCALFSILTLYLTLFAIVCLHKNDYKMSIGFIHPIPSRATFHKQYARMAPYSLAN